MSRFIRIFLLAFLLALADRIAGIKFAENIWINAAMWGLLLAVSIESVDWLHRKYCAGRK